VHEAVNTAQKIYEHKKRSKALKWLTKFSSRISIYGSALDMLAQHHPEYLALAWGSIKFIVIGLMNHEELVKELAKALCRIGDALPQAEFHLLLYPTTTMTNLIATLYVNIIKFSRRAMKWFSENRALHLIKSITHPYSLRFQDMVENIQETSQRIQSLALNLSLGELRKTRLELESSRRDQQSIHAIASETKAKLDCRQVVRDFAVDAIDLIIEAQIPVIWALGMQNNQPLFVAEDDAKYLVSQVLRQNHALLSERSAALSAARYQSATTMNEWFDLLGSALAGMQQAYFIIDLELVHRSIGGAMVWSQLFEQLFQALRFRGCTTVLKIAFLGSRMDHRKQLTEFDQKKIVQLPRAKAGRVTKASKGQRLHRERRTDRKKRQNTWFPKDAAVEMQLD
ncbi:hypothetical protein EJ04DRAFT_598270, partial [Polyplosphaeria fusca]